MADRGPTLAEWERRCRKALSLVKRIVVMQHDDLGGWIIYKHSSIRELCIDPFWHGMGPLVVHELCHYMRRGIEGSRGDFDEPETLANEAALWDYIKSRHRLHRWWRREINRRLVMDDGEGEE